jgi:rRNA maturation endonuclease Nob1
MRYLRGETAFAAFSRYAIWLRHCAACRRLVTAVCDQDFFKHCFGSKLERGAKSRASN